MFHFPELNIDRLSFWLGFLAASLLWWLAGRLRPWLPHWLKQIRAVITDIRQKSLAGVDGFIREETVRRAQTKHIASSLFSLDEICIQPRLLAPPSGQNPNEISTIHSIASQIIPYLPDWPEMISCFGVPTFTPYQAIQNGTHLAIIGQPGSGKTVTLAHLACQLARRENTQPEDFNYLPILAHVLDLQMDPQNSQDPLQPIIKEISSRAAVLIQSQVTNYLKGVSDDPHSRLIVLLDGLDELQPSALKETVKYIGALINQYPRIQVITAASPNYLDGLTQLGFLPLAIQAWKPADRAQLAQKWSDLWNKHFEPEIKKLPEYQSVDSEFYDFWISGDENVYLSPLEWTMRLWGAFSGNLSGSIPTEIIHAHIMRFLSDPMEVTAASALALHLVKNQLTDIAFEDAEKILNSSRQSRQVQSPVTQPEEPSNQPSNNPGAQVAGKSRRELSLSPGERMLTGLTNAGILVENLNEQFRFTCPVFQGYLAGMAIETEDAQQLVNNLSWSAAVETLHYASARPEHSTWVMSLIEDPAPPLFQTVLTACRWLREVPVNSEWRSHLMRTLVILIQNEAYPLSVRLKFATAFFLSRDTSTSRLYKHLITSGSPAIRRIALLGCGALGNEQFINDILALIADPVTEVRMTACLALSVIPSETALNAVVEILLSGDEEIRRAASESLANNAKDGYKLLEEAATIEDLLARRASVFGLALIHEPWSQKILEKIAVEDSQWVVRNAAAQALEIKHPIQQYIPQSLPPPWESPWLLTFASKLGMGILPGHDALDVLMRVLNSGSEEEQIAALFYLRNHPTENVIAELYQMVYGLRDNLREPALQALWWMGASGYELPSPAKYGLG